MVDGTADQLAMSELAIRSTDHTAVSGEDAADAPTSDAFDDVPAVGRRNLSSFSSSGTSQPSGPKSTMLTHRCLLGRIVIGAVLAVPSGKGSAWRVHTLLARSMLTPKTSK